MATAPTPIAAGPTVPDRTVAEPTFDAQYEAFNAWEKNELQPGANALADNVFANANEAFASATMANNFAVAASASSGAAPWSAGSYVTGAAAYSLVNGLVYRRKAPGGSSPTDPSADSANWDAIVAGDVTLGGTQTLTNKTLTSPAINTPTVNTPTITNYTETVNAPAGGTAFTVNLANGTMQKLTTTGNVTITLPAAAAGKSYALEIAYGGTHTVTWAGGTSIKWAGGTAPAATSVNGKKDVYVFTCFDAAETLAQDGGRNF